MLFLSCGSGNLKSESLLKKTHCLTQGINKMMATMVFGCALGLMFVVTVKGIQHNNKVMKESAKLHEQNIKQNFNS